MVQPRCLFKLGSQLDAGSVCSVRRRSRSSRDFCGPTEPHLAIYHNVRNVKAILVVPSVRLGRASLNLYRANENSGKKSKPPEPHLAVYHNVRNVKATLAVPSVWLIHLDVAQKQSRCRKTFESTRERNVDVTSDALSHLSLSPEFPRRALAPPCMSKATASHRAREEEAHPSHPISRYTSATLSAPVSHKGASSHSG